MFRAKRVGLRWSHAKVCTVPLTEPLNILFFGSDQFSIHSLQALNKLKASSPQLINKLQPVVRPAKRCGRNLAKVKDVPLAKYSFEAGLPAPIECDSKADMLGPVMEALKGGEYNMIVAVSFGQLIAKNLITQVPYTLNVHPSLLPRYKGPSPIQRALMNRDEATGVSIQTLHPEKFDNGQILAQTKPVKIESLLNATPSGITVDRDVPPKVAKLMDSLGALGADLLVQVLRERLYAGTHNIRPLFPESYAPKVTTQMKQLQWASDSATQALGKIDALGPLYTFKEAMNGKLKAPILKRIMFHKIAPYNDAEPAHLSTTPGAFDYEENHKRFLIRLGNGECLQCSEIQFEGYKVETPEQFCKSLRKRCGAELANQKVFVTQES